MCLFFGNSVIFALRLSVTLHKIGVLCINSAKTVPFRAVFCRRFRKKRRRTIFDLTFFRISRILNLYGYTPNYDADCREAFAEREDYI